MAFKLRIVPDVRDLIQEQRDRKILLPYVTVKSAGHQSDRLELNLVLQAMAISRKRPTRSQFYIAAIGAEITLTAIGAEIIDYTKSSSIPVEYTTSRQTEKGRVGKIDPELKSELGKAKAEVKVGTFEMSSKETRGSSVKYSSEEDVVVATAFADTIRWNIDIPRGEKAVRDFLLGNRLLHATFKWKGTARKGKIQSRSDILFFDSNKRVLSPLASLMMRFVLWRQKINLGDAAEYQGFLSEAA